MNGIPPPKFFEHVQIYQPD